mmetsp:Transcript_35336/g.83834  ORF Transcript_35336/g.83834 Transcript_35336/m.83834 type:complete len:242 (+) Transcript_35336:274-999(+)
MFTKHLRIRSNWVSRSPEVESELPGDEARLALGLKTSFVSALSLRPSLSTTSTHAVPAMWGLATKVSTLPPWLTVARQGSPSTETYIGPLCSRCCEALPTIITLSPPAVPTASGLMSHRQNHPGARLGLAAARCACGGRPGWPGLSPKFGGGISPSNAGLTLGFAGAASGSSWSPRMGPAAHAAGCGSTGGSMGTAHTDVRIASGRPQPPGRRSQGQHPGWALSGSCTAEKGSTWQTSSAV